MHACIVLRLQSIVQTRLDPCGVCWCMGCAASSKPVALRGRAKTDTFTLPLSVPLLQAVVDVVASSGWLHPALAAMEMCQMVVQGQWEKDSPLLQLPHITPQLAAAAAAKDISTVFDLIEMDDEERRELLQVCAAGRLVRAGGYASSHGKVEQRVCVLGVASGGRLWRHAHAALQPLGASVLTGIPAHAVAAIAVAAGVVQLSDRQLDELTAVCNRYPDISVATELPEGPDVAAGAGWFVSVCGCCCSLCDRDGTAHSSGYPASRCDTRSCRWHVHWVQQWLWCRCTAVY